MRGERRSRDKVADFSFFRGGGGIKDCNWDAVFTGREEVEGLGHYLWKVPGLTGLAEVF